MNRFGIRRVERCSYWPNHHKYNAETVFCGVLGKAGETDDRDMYAFLMELSRYPGYVLPNLLQTPCFLDTDADPGSAHTVIKGEAFCKQPADHTPW